MVIATNQAEKEYIKSWTEGDLQKQVVDAAKKLNWTGYHTWLSAHSAGGFPDWMFVRERIIFVELKRQNKDPTPKQTEWLERLSQAGQEVYIWRPSDWFDGTVANVLSRNEAGE
jgi:hypothetical protein